jgi:Domain of unknown function (DUF4832)/Domain of unknown function (DUF4874)
MKFQSCILAFFLLSFFLYATGSSQVRVNYKSSDEIIYNPERGFYTELTSQAEQSPLTISSLEQIRAKGQSLILRMYYLKTFRYRPLNEVELNLIKNDFNVLRQVGMKCILRFAYSEDIGQQDAPLDIVLEHISQLKPILQENSDVIAVMQAGFIGAWGEWHSSTNGLDTVTNRQKILFAILNALPANRMVQVRTPHYKREVFDRTTPITRVEAFNGSMYSRVGQHDDCFLANWNDYGTYSDTVEEEQFISEDCKYVPMGGETCNPSPYSTCSNAIYQMEKLHWSFLNSGYNPVIIDGWKKNGCFDKIAKRLGYRFQLLEGVFNDSLRPGGGFRFDIRLTNTGFASLFNPRDVELIILNQSGKGKYFVKLPDDPRFWEPGDTVDLSGEAGLPEDMPNGKYSVYLNLPDPAPRLHAVPYYSVRFADEDMWDSSSGYNNLNYTLLVQSGEGGRMYTGLYYFQPLTVPEEMKSVNHENKKGHRK